jgi:dTDP-4-dehydrorhamnose reductase
MIDQFVIGASGQVGHHILTCLKKNKKHIVGTCYQHKLPNLISLNILDAVSVQNTIQELHPRIIFLPAALSNVDYCETHPEEAYAINVIGTLNVVKAANMVKAKLVFFSTDCIFDGINGPYGEEDAPNPICVYGNQKLIAESIISQQTTAFLIIRTTVVYGWELQGKNFVYRVMNTLRRGEMISVPHDQIGNPTYAPDLARAVCELVEHEAQGVINVVGEKWISRYDFSLAIAKIFELDATRIQPVSTLELDQTARRPLRVGLTTHKFFRQSGYQLPDCMDGLKRMKTEYFS